MHGTQAKARFEYGVCTGGLCEGAARAQLGDENVLTPAPEGRRVTSRLFSGVFPMRAALACAIHLVLLSR